MILHLGQLPVNQALSAFGVTSWDVCPPSVKLSAVLPAGFPLSIINTSVDGQWTFYRGHFNETEQCLPCTSQWETFSSVFLKFSHFPSECWKPLPRKHNQETLRYHRDTEFWRNALNLKIYISAGNVLPPSVAKTAWNSLRGWGDSSLLVFHSYFLLLTVFSLPSLKVCPQPTTKLPVLVQ